MTPTDRKRSISLTEEVSVPEKHSRKVVRKVYAISDLHVDYKENLNFIKSWDAERFNEDALIVAGDVTDSLRLLESTLRTLKAKFREVLFVPGNHELWLRPNENCRDSVVKFKRIVQMCERLGVYTTPLKFHLSDDADSDKAVWIVPLHSWYATPEEDLADSLYMTSPNFKTDTKVSEAMWMDNHMTKWPKLPGTTKSAFFAAMNEPHVQRDYDAPVITFSHMVPRRDLIPPVPRDTKRINDDRHQRGLGICPPYKNTDGFNFTRYAGANVIDKQARAIGSLVHVFGHQHRNRDRQVEGVHYVSHCLGSVKEQKEGWMYGLLEWNGPRQVFPMEPPNIKEL